MSDEKITTDHNEIREWVEKVQGKPQLQTMHNTETEQVGLRIDFPGDADDTYLSQDHPPKDVSWEEFFKAFDEQELAFSYNDPPDKFDPSMSYRFLPRANMKTS